MRSKILFIDDLDENLLNYQEFGEKYFPNDEIITSSSPKKAASILSITPDINVIITDMNMDDNEEAGLKFLKSIIRNQVKHSRQRLIPVIVVTAYNNKRIEKRCLKIGCFDFFLKPLPINLEEFVSFDEALTNSINQGILLSRSKRNWQLPVEKLILENWTELTKTQLSPKEKGDLLEDLVYDIFSSILGWEKIKRNVKFEYEEIDLMIFNNSTELFWKEHGKIILVECKNWKDKPESSVLGTFFMKIDRRLADDCRLGFFISLSGFTSGFIKATKEIPIRRGIIVNLDKEDLWKLIIAHDRKAFLKDLLIERGIMKLPKI